jgi:putative IMPACT (imprinted ancient) family translation regulator
VKLGTGGLSRAYASGVKLALGSLPTEERVDRVTLEIAAGYGDVDALHRLFDRVEGVVEEEDFGADVRWRVAVPETRVAELKAAVAEVTRGEGRIS